MAEKKNISVPRGSSVRLIFRNKAGVALPGSTVKFTVSRAPNSSTKIIPTKACSTPDEQGDCYCDVTADETDVTPGEFFYDARVVTAGSETLLVSGVFSITPIAQLPAAS